jgi:hypothetical protein
MVVGVYQYFQIKLLLYFVNSLVLLAPREASTGGGTILRRVKQKHDDSSLQMIVAN